MHMAEKSGKVILMCWRRTRVQEIPARPNPFDLHYQLSIFGKPQQEPEQLQEQLHLPWKLLLSLMPHRLVCSSTNALIYTPGRQNKFQAG